MNVYTSVKSRSPETEQDGCIRFSDVSWQQFEGIEAAFKDVRGVRNPTLKSGGFWKVRLVPSGARRKPEPYQRQD